ncbi:MAG: type II toxin-antitoxin system YafQ family toxin [Methylotetracoccus sp.]|nr:type II toxin-antitoxin system YafQ family toxin [Methylotetracoccus sp.]
MWVALYVVDQIGDAVQRDRPQCSFTSKKPAQQKRASLPRSSDRTKQFEKDWVRLSHSGRYDMRRLKEAIEKSHVRRTTATI